MLLPLRVLQVLELKNACAHRVKLHAIINYTSAIQSTVYLFGTS